MHPFRDEAPRRLFLATSNRVLALELETGVIAWERGLGDVPHKPTNNLAYRAPVLLYEERLFSAVSTTIVCLRQADGGVIWATPLDLAADLTNHSAMALDVVGAARRLIVALHGTVHALDADTGALLWENNLKGLGYRPLGLGLAGAIVAAAPT